MNQSFLYKLKLNSLRVLGRGFGLLGFKGLGILSDGLGVLVWVFYKERRNLAVNNIQLSFNCSKEDAEKIAKKSFKQNMRSFLDIFLTDKLGLADEGNRLVIDNPEIFKGFFDGSRPTLAIGAHIGAWELLAAAMGDVYGDKRANASIVRGYADQCVEEFVMEKRMVKGAAVCIRDHTKVSLRVLNKNGAIAILVDHRPSFSDAIYVPFLNRNTAMTKGAAVLALRVNAIIRPVFLVRSEDKYILKTPDPLDTALLQGTKEEKIQEVVTFYTRAVENIIREYPDQWFWLHNRWKELNPSDKDIRRAESVKDRE